MSGKYVLIPLKTFEEICSGTKKNGAKITGVIHNLKSSNESTRKRTAGSYGKSTKRAKITKKNSQQNFESSSTHETDSSDSE